MRIVEMAADRGLDRSGLGWLINKNMGLKLLIGRRTRIMVVDFAKVRNQGFEDIDKRFPLGLRTACIDNADHQTVCAAAAHISDCHQIIFNRIMIREKVKSAVDARSEEHTSELQSLMRISYAVFCLKKKNKKNNSSHTVHQISTPTITQQ